jgi:hypothetical protein
MDNAEADLLAVDGCYRKFSMGNVHGKWPSRSCRNSYVVVGSKYDVEPNQLC